MDGIRNADEIALKMLTLAALLLGCAVLLGLRLFTLSPEQDTSTRGPDGSASPRLRRPGVIHGAVGVSGFLAFLLSAQLSNTSIAVGGRGQDGSYRSIAVGLLAGGLIAAASIILARLGNRPVPALLITIHASLAAAGALLVAASL